MSTLRRERTKEVSPEKKVEKVAAAIPVTIHDLEVGLKQLAFVNAAATKPQQHQKETAEALQKRFDALRGKPSQTPVNLVSSLQTRLNTLRGDTGGLRRRALEASEGAQTATQMTQALVQGEAAAVKQQIADLKDDLKGDVATKEQTAQVLAMIAALQQQLSAVQARQEEHIGMTTRISEGVEGLKSMSKSLLIGQAQLKDLALENLAISKTIKGQIQKLYDRDFGGFFSSVLYNEWAYLALYIMIHPYAPITTEIFTTLWTLNLSRIRLTRHLFEDIERVKGSVKYGAFGVAELYLSHPWKAIAYLVFLNAKYLGMRLSGVPETVTAHETLFPGTIEKAATAAVEATRGAFYTSAGEFSFQAGIAATKEAAGHGVNVLSGMSEAAFRALVEKKEDIWQLLQWVFGNPSIACNYLYSLLTTGKVFVTVQEKVVTIVMKSPVATGLKDIVLAEGQVIAAILSAVFAILRSIVRNFACSVLPRSTLYLMGVDCKEKQAGGGSRSRGRSQKKGVGVDLELDLRAIRRDQDTEKAATLSLLHSRAKLGLQFVSVLLANEAWGGAAIPPALLRHFALNYAVAVGVTTSPTYMGRQALPLLEVPHSHGETRSRSRTRTRSKKVKVE